MGSTFKYIADNALVESALGACQHCGRQGVPTYDYHGVIINPSKAANVQLAKDDSEVFALCADCILSGNVRKDEYELSRIDPIVKAFSNDRDTAIANYHLIPHIPLMMQDEDWPMCCGDWCEFLGSPADYDASVAVPRNHLFWDHRPDKWHFDYDLRPESLREVCLFHCLECKNAYFIWQPT